MSNDNASQKSASMGIIFDVPKAPKGGSSAPEKDTVSDQSSSHLSSHGDVFDVTKVFQSEHGESGTIISDKRRHRQSFGESLRKAFGEWWGDAKVTVEKAVATMPKLTADETTVAAATTRADVVGEAVKHSTIAPRDDHHTVLEQFHTYKNDVARMTGAPQIVIKQPSSKNTQGTWAHRADAPSAKQTEPKIIVTPLDLRSSMIAPDITRKSVKGPYTIIPPIVPQKNPGIQSPEVVSGMSEKIMVAPLPDVVSHSSYASKAEENTQPESVGPTAPLMEPLPREPLKTYGAVPPLRMETETDIPNDLSEANTSPTVSTSTLEQTNFVEQNEEVTDQSAPTRTRLIEPIHTATATHVFHTVRSKPHTREDTEGVRTPFDFSILLALPKIVWQIIGGVVLMGVLIGSGVGIYFAFFDGTDTPTYTIASFYDAGTPIGIPLTEDRNAFHTLFTEQLSVPGMQNVQVYPTLVINKSFRPATSKEFFATLDMHLPRTLESSLDDSFMIGGIMTTTPEPYLIIRSYNFDALFAGLLEWENTLAQDLSPLFGTASTPGMFFTDAVQHNKSTRILRNVDGSEILLYSFINQNTVIITTSGNALSALLEKF